MVRGRLPWQDMHRPHGGLVCSSDWWDWVNCAGFAGWGEEDPHPGPLPQAGEGGRKALTVALSHVWEREEERQGVAVGLIAEEAGRMPALLKMR